MMTKRSETRKIKAKREEWERTMYPFNRWRRRTWKNSMNILEKAFNWYFFYSKPKDKGDRAYHILLWVFATWVIFRALGLGWG